MPGSKLSHAADVSAVPTQARTNASTDEHPDDTQTYSKTLHDARFHISLTHAPINIPRLHDFVSDPAAGAIVTFTGVTRGVTSVPVSGSDRGSRGDAAGSGSATESTTANGEQGGHKRHGTHETREAQVTREEQEPPGKLITESLTYTSYTSLALRTLERIATDALFCTSSFSTPALPSSERISKLAITHRLGTCAVGVPSIVVAVSAPHRRRAFEVAEEVLERVKRGVEVWKFERFVSCELRENHDQRFDEDGKMVEEGLAGEEADADAAEGRKRKRLPSGREPEPVSGRREEDSWTRTPANGNGDCSLESASGTIPASEDGTRVKRFKTTPTTVVGYADEIDGQVEAENRDRDKGGEAKSRDAAGPGAEQNGPAIWKANFPGVRPGA